MAKRLWSVLVTFFMIRKGLVSKRKLIMDMNLMIKRGKLLRKTMTNLIFHHRHMAAAARRSGYGDYEFSCSNSPNPVFFRALKRKRGLNYFPCMNPPRVIEEDNEWNPKESNLMMVPRSPLLASPFVVRVSSFSSEDEDGDGDGDGDVDDGRNGRVDDEAEEFIRRFYEQLRTQSRTQLLQYDQED